MMEAEHTKSSKQQFWETYENQYQNDIPSAGIEPVAFPLLTLNYLPQQSTHLLSSISSPLMIQ
jgi:hypothetical protein